MNWRVNFSKKAAAAWLSVAGAMALPAAPAVQSTEVDAAPRSVFVLPANPKEGRDPFYPASSRPYETATAGRPQVGDVSSLVLKGISGPPDRRLVIINNHTFAAGDEEDLVTAQGRIHIRCVEIKARSVVIESAGQRHELTYANNR